MTVIEQLMGNMIMLMVLFYQQNAYFAQNFKHSQSLIADLVVKIIKYSKNRILLTGTFICVPLSPT